ncbi:hypothetical protein B484DRAFT_444388 [Ochromonadaceae sp. CCMP2298]|nr:hypothetical protein B484DRAFT_444388 [Ochromonadaceae sp. CCMP2298]
MQLLFISALLLAISMVHGFSGLKPSMAIRVRALSMKAEGSFDAMRLVKTAGAMAVMAPMAAHADGVNAVAFPLAISILTMVPFIYYSQQLKPKVRTVKQIELDENLREVKQPKKKGPF